MTAVNHNDLPDFLEENRQQKKQPEKKEKGPSKMEITGNMGTKGVGIALSKLLLPKY